MSPRSAPSVATFAWVVLACVVLLGLASAGAAGAAGTAGAAVRDSAAPGPRVALAPQAQCHGERCFVVLRVRDSPGGRAVVRAEDARRVLTLTAGASRRVVGLPRTALEAPVLVRHRGVAHASRVATRALATNTASSACARLGATEAYLSVGPTSRSDAAVNLPSRGALRVAAIFVDFADAAGSGDPVAAHRSLFAESADYLDVSSYGRFATEVAMVPGWVRMPRASDRYGLADGITYDEHLVYLQDAVDAADASVDFTGIDLVVVTASRSAALWTSAAFRGTPGTLSADEGTLGPALTLGSDAPDVEGVLLPHELAHTLGLPDLYAFAPTRYHRYVGGWDFMGDIYNTPTDLMAWQRSKLGWLDPEQTLCATGPRRAWVRLAPLSAPPTTAGSKAVFVRTGPTTGVMVEHRTRRGNDAGICKPGALVYALDSSTPSGMGPIRVAGGSPRGCGSGDRSNAPLSVGERIRTDGVTVTVLGRDRGELEVLVRH